MSATTVGVLILLAALLVVLVAGLVQAQMALRDVRRVDR